jgi:carbonic anhydrase
MPSSWEPFGSTRRLAEEAERRSPAAAPSRSPAAAAQPAPTPAEPSAPRPQRALAREPARKLVVITCMDARIDPLAVCGLELGDANVIRNAGATISDDVLRSLHLSQSQLGTRGALLIGHTDCAGYQSDEAAEAAVRAGLARIRSTAALPAGFRLEGLMYDVRTGTLSPVG